METPSTYHLRPGLDANRLVSSRRGLTRDWSFIRIVLADRPCQSVLREHHAAVIAGGGEDDRSCTLCLCKVTDIPATFEDMGRGLIR
jgi:hypothetical protein